MRLEIISRGFRVLVKREMKEIDMMTVNTMRRVDELIIFIYFRGLKLL